VPTPEAASTSATPISTGPTASPRP
jgi:hypothetical protein